MSVCYIKISSVISCRWLALRWINPVCKRGSRNTRHLDRNPRSLLNTTVFHLWGYISRRLRSMLSSTTCQRKFAYDSSGIIPETSCSKRAVHADVVNNAIAEAIHGGTSAVTHLRNSAKRKCSYAETSMERFLVQQTPHLIYTGRSACAVR